MTSPAPDQAWAEYARASRDALAALGYGITPRCLPDEVEPCGATYAQHSAAHLATIKAVCDHQLEHLGPLFAAMHGRIYLDTRAELESVHECVPTNCHGVPHV